MQKTKEIEKVIKEKVQYKVCDKCGAEILEDSLRHSINFVTKTISGKFYIQGEFFFDCCDKCCHELMDKYFKKSK